MYQEDESSQSEWIINEDELEVRNFHRSDVNLEVVDATVIKRIDKQISINDIDDDKEDEKLHEYCNDQEDSNIEDYDNE